MIDTTSLLAELKINAQMLAHQCDLAREAETESARLKAAMPCGHPGACVVTGAEGTQYCGACEREKVIEDGIRSECETLAQFALSHAWGQEKHWRERFERLRDFFSCAAGDWFWNGSYSPSWPVGMRQEILNAILGEGNEP